MKHIVTVPFDKYEAHGAYHWAGCDRDAGLFYNPSLEARYKLLVERVAKVEHPERLLDVGCGDGYLMAQVSSLLKAVVGIDSERAGVDLAHEKLCSFANCKIIQGDCYNLPFDDMSFDIVLLADVIEHLIDPEECLKEISRILRPTGVLILSTPKWRPDRKWDSRHVTEYKPEELRAFLELHFKHVDISYFWPIFWSDIYSTKLGWRLVKYMSKYMFNPFLMDSTEDVNNFGQILAFCRN